MLHSSAQGEQIPFGKILGVPVSDFSRDEALAFVHGRIAARCYTPVTFLNAHNANVAMRDPEFRRVLDGFAVLPDGVGVDIAARILRGARFKANLNGTDFVPDVLRSAGEPLKIGLFGARPGVAERAAAIFRGLDPRHEYRVIHHGFLEPGDEERILAGLAEWRPDILLVALGVPLQEKWIARMLDGNLCTVPMGIGALFDLVTGTVPRAPQWVRALRGEWIFRLAQEPRRLWRRYLVGNPVFLVSVLREKLIGKAG
jgi:exopolysaccharide biosynthesis WecB/TagA/CpsF family protein